MRISFLAVSMLALACFIFSGCDNAATDTASSTKTGDSHSHDHDHDHGDHDHDHGDHDHDHGGHAHGPNGGHPFEFEGGEFAGEWKHYNDNHIIRVYILDKAGKKNAWVKADSVTITRMTGEDPEVFTLDPEKPNDKGEAALYSLDDQNLAIAMNLKVKIEMKIGEETYTAVIAEHQPHDH